MYNKILLPVDGREGAWRAIKAAEHAIQICNGEIVLLRVEKPINQLIQGAARKELKDQSDQHGIGRLQPVVDFLESKGIKHRELVQRGDVADCIVKVSHDEEVDAIVMFTDGVQGITDFVFGSVTQRVLKDINCDLLSIRK